MCCDILFVKNASNPSQESNAPSQDVYRQQQCSMLVGKSILSMDEYTFIRSCPYLVMSCNQAGSLAKVWNYSCNIPSKTAMALTCPPKAIMTYEESATSYGEYTLIWACPHTVMPCISSSKLSNISKYSCNIPSKVMAITRPSSYDEMDERQTA